ncbi:MAG TPA: hypothetical protein VIJ94_10275 [Caulobacteraceae bacterium]
MAGLWCEHFLEYANDTQLLDGVYAANTGFTLGTQPVPAPRPGAKYLYWSGSPQNNIQLRRIFGGPKTGAGFGLRLYLSALPAFDGTTGNGSGVFLGFLNAGGLMQAGVFLGSDGGLIFCHGVLAGWPAGLAFTIVGRSAPCITARTWQYIEMSCSPDPAVGTFEVRVNGTTVYNYTGNTDPQGTAEVSQAYMQAVAGIQHGVGDHHAWDNALGNGPSNFTGNIAVLRRELDGDTAQADWSLSTGTVGYVLLIDENDATYIEADAAGPKSAFQAAALASGVAGILYQQVKWRGLKTDAADCDVAPSLINGSSETSVVGQHMTTLETWRWGIFGDDPLTAAPWTLSGANASLPAVTRTL